MDWTTIIISCVPAIITATVSYLTARHQGKNDLQKASQENEANIERLMAQHEIDIEALREKHKMDMEAKDKELEHKLQIMQKEYELKIAENKTIKADNFTNNYAANFIERFMQNPTEGQKNLEALKRLQDMFGSEPKK